MFAEQIYYSSETYRELAKFLDIRTGRMVNILVVFIDPSREPFDDLRVRQFLAGEIRKTVGEITGLSAGSFFPNILSGYLPEAELRKGVDNFSHAEKALILQKMRKHSVPWFEVEKSIGFLQDKLFYSQTMDRLGLLQNPPARSVTEKDRVIQKVSGQISWLNIKHTETEPLDKVAHLLTGNSYSFSKWARNDTVVKSIVMKLKNKKGGGNDPKLLKNLNRYLYEQSVVAVVSNHSRVLMTLKGSKLYVPYDGVLDASYFFRQRATK